MRVTMLRHILPVELRNIIENSYTSKYLSPTIHAEMRSSVTNNSPWVVGQAIIVSASMLIMCD